VVSLGARCWRARRATTSPADAPRADGPFATRALDLLADPATKAPLTAQRGQLVCESTGVAYPVRRGVPDFLQPGPRRRSWRR
jgi:uncharacterized protein YbaR (Trm112 family)